MQVSNAVNQQNAQHDRFFILYTKLSRRSRFQWTRSFHTRLDKSRGNKKQRKPERQSVAHDKGNTLMANYSLRKIKQNLARASHALLPRVSQDRRSCLSLSASRTRFTRFGCKIGRVHAL